MSWDQVAHGLYGPLIIDGDDYPSVDHDFNLMIDDWRLDQDNQIDDDSFGIVHHWLHAGTCNPRYGHGFRGQLISQYLKSRVKTQNCLHGRTLSHGLIMRGNFWKLCNLDTIISKPAGDQRQIRITH